MERKQHFGPAWCLEQVFILLWWHQYVYCIQTTTQWLFMPLATQWWVNREALSSRSLGVYVYVFVWYYRQTNTSKYLTDDNEAVTKISSWGRGSESCVFRWVVRKGLSVEIASCRELEEVLEEATQKSKGNNKSKGPEFSLKAVPFHL